MDITGSTLLINVLPICFSARNTTVDDILSAMSVSLYADAAAWILRRSTEVRLVVVSGGCAGLRYDWSYDVGLRRIVLCRTDGVTVYTNAPSLPLLDGAHIKLKSGLMGRGLEVCNPNIRRLCRCAKSFLPPPIPHKS